MRTTSQSPYRTPPPEAKPSPRRGPRATWEIVAPAAFVWLASLARIGGAAAGRIPPDRDLALAVVLLFAFSIVLWREAAPHVCPPDDG